MSGCHPWWEAPWSRILESGWGVCGLRPWGRKAPSVEGTACVKLGGGRHGQRVHSEQTGAKLPGELG